MYYAMSFALLININIISMLECIDGQLRLFKKDKMHCEELVQYVNYTLKNYFYNENV